MNIAVFASGSGSNYEALMRHFEQSGWREGQVVLVVCDQPGAYVLERARKWATPCLCLSPRDYADKVGYEQAILEVLREHEVEFIVLAGYMRLLGPTLLGPYSGRIVNIHPSLLPAFPGLDAIGQALEQQVRLTGVTVHYVDEGMDTGPIIAQEAVSVTAGETRESLTKKIQAVEHVLYPRVVQACVQGDVQFKGGKVEWRQR